VRILLRQDNLAVAAQLARQYELPLTQARVLIAQDDPFTALAMLESYRQQMAAHGWVDEQLKAIVLQAVALYVCGDKKKALDLLGEALALAEPGGFIRLFVDEGEPMRLMISDFRLVLEKQLHGYDRKRLGYVDKLLAAFEPRQPRHHRELGIQNSHCLSH
jgi:LuxR family maltose regulon positive regulatory protein